MLLRIKYVLVTLAEAYLMLEYDIIVWGLLSYILVRLLYYALIANTVDTGSGVV